MTTVILSDLHLTDKKEASKYVYLKRLFLRYDKIILAGDFFDGYLVSFESFVTSSWKGLFGILKEKRTIYLYGNHDKSSYCDERVATFSVYQGVKYSMKSGSVLFHVEHGDRIAPAEDDYGPYFLRTKYVVKPYVYLREYLPLKLFGIKSLEQYRINNIRMLDWIRTNKPKKNEIWVCGHSHLAQYTPENNFINTGFVRFGFAQYLEIDGDRIRLVSERY